MQQVRALWYLVSLSCFLVPGLSLCPEDISTILEEITEQTRVVKSAALSRCPSCDRTCETCFADIMKDLEDDVTDANAMATDITTSIRGNCEANKTIFWNSNSDIFRTSPDGTSSPLGLSMTVILDLTYDPEIDKLVVATSSGALTVNTDGTDQQPAFPGAAFLTDIVPLGEGRYILLEQQTNIKIYDNGVFTDIFTEPASEIFKIGFNPVTKKVYYINRLQAVPGTLFEINLDGSGRNLVVTDIFIGEIAIHVPSQKLYYTTWMNPITLKCVDISVPGGIKIPQTLVDPIPLFPFDLFVRDDMVSLRTPVGVLQIRQLDGTLVRSLTTQSVSQFGSHVLTGGFCSRIP